MITRTLVILLFMIFFGPDVSIQAQTTVIEVNLKDCLDDDPESAEQDNCPPGNPSPWTSCPSGECLPFEGDACVIPSGNINFSQWTHFTNGYYFNPPVVAPGDNGRTAVEVDRMLCSFFRACPCKRAEGGGRVCIMVEYTEEWLIKYERSNDEVCVGGGIVP
jgi:hypothetical protein